MTTTAVFDSSYRERTFNVFESCEEDKQSGLSRRKSSASLKHERTDSRRLACALAGDAQHIITEDRHLLELGEYQGILILSPAGSVALLNLQKCLYGRSPADTTTS